MDMIASDERLPVGYPLTANWDMKREGASFQDNSTWQIYYTILDLRIVVNQALEVMKTKAAPTDDNEIFVAFELGLGKDKESREQQLEKELREEDQ